MKPISEIVGTAVRICNDLQSQPDTAPDSDVSICPVCCGIGYVRKETESVHDPEFGKLIPCPACSSSVNLTLSNLTPPERDWTWDAVKNLNNANLAVVKVKETMERGYGWVYLWGNPGLAKTIILKVACAEAIRKAMQPSYVRMVEIIDHLRSAFDKDNPSGESERRLEQWAKLPLLAIDEFDRLRDTEYVKERRFLLMDRRWESAIRKESITLFASNASPESFADDYLLSRINDGRFSVIHLEGRDVRPAMDWWDDH